MLLAKIGRSKVVILLSQAENMEFTSDIQGFQQLHGGLQQRHKNTQKDFLWLPELRSLPQENSFIFFFTPNIWHRATKQKAHPTHSIRWSGIFSSVRTNETESGVTSVTPPPENQWPFTIFILLFHATGVSKRFLLKCWNYSAAKLAFRRFMVSSRPSR